MPAKIAKRSENFSRYFPSRYYLTREADMLKSFRPAIPALFLALSAAGVNAQQEIVFENLDNYTGRHADVRGEYGDELILTGTARTVTEFIFSYFGDFVPSADESAKVRFYMNDVLIDNPGPDDYLAPGTLLFESGWFPIKVGLWEKSLTGMNVVVPNNFTYTVEFRGVSMNAGDVAGLLFYDPINRGRSFDDFWAREGNAPFELLDTPGLKDNFGAMVVAVPEPSTIAFIGSGLLALGLAARKRR